MCGGTGCWSSPYSKNNNEYIVKNITLPEYNILNWANYNDIVSFVDKNEIYGVLAAPPCTMFSIARIDNTAIAPRNLRQGINIVMSCLELIWECIYKNFRYSGPGIKFWALENPETGYLKRFLGRPALVFQPYEFGDPYKKKTALWGEFKDPIKNIVEPIKLERGKRSRDFITDTLKYMHLKPSIPDGYKEKTKISRITILRSMTPLGFANAFYDTNR